MKRISYALLAISILFSACTEENLEMKKPDHAGGPKKDKGGDDGGSNTEVIHYLTGNSEDIQTNSSLGYLLAGGAGDQKSWFDWMVTKADGGDFVILRTDDSNGYNDASFIEGANSILTLVVNGQTSANSDFVRDKIREAEALFIAGGDQTSYYNLWNGTEVESSIQYLVNEKGVPVGGTSAGLAILGEFAYIPQSSGVISSEALSDPYHPYLETIKTDFLQLPGLGNIITDTHFSERDRLGRTITLMARLIADGIVSSYQDIKAIAVDEFTAVAIEPNGDAKVLGDENYEDYAFFFEANSTPNQCEAGQELHWTDAITAYTVKGVSNPNTSFNIGNWATVGSVAQFENVNINYGSISNDIQQPN
ncbi:Peptidase family S51 [Marivirga sericea]|uniref:Peptidase family S51 n=1 Tax=Marivirga sericea TaxID=1028 RepID=A0A1X7JPD8_9BACT|nr:cyanophycinase [Marivirga sericea]SMG30066.1 Peptidase family S51 [Marivirga sericea]